MSSDESFLRDVVAALDRVGLEALVVGSVAAVLNGAPGDVIASKEAAGRPKDLAQLPILRETQRVRGALKGGA